MTSFGFDSTTDDVLSGTDLTGTRVVVTGASAGLGLETARSLAAHGASVVGVVRDVDRARAALDEVGATAVELYQADLASLASVRAFTDAFVADGHDRIDVLIANAGIMACPQATTADGFELQFGTNHLGHFMLNHLLFDLVAARSGRIVPVSSIAHRQPKGINFDDPMLSNGYSATNAYTQSKLANLMYGLELARRLTAANSEVMSVSAHPGYSATNLQSTGPTGFYKAIYKVSNALMAQSAVDGAVPEVLAAAGSEARNGAYYGPTKFGDARGPVGESRISDAAKDEDAARRLWALSEELLGITFDVS